ncbi:hypothetical protein D3C81_1866590 [compost metagenome]
MEEYDYEPRSGLMSNFLLILSIVLISGTVFYSVQRYSYYTNLNKTTFTDVTERVENLYVTNQFELEIKTRELRKEFPRAEIEYTLIDDSTYYMNIKVKKLSYGKTYYYSKDYLDGK